MAIRSYKGTLPRIAAGAYVDEQAAVIGDVEIGADSSVWPMCSVRGDVNYIRIGARTSVQDGTVIHVTHPHETISGGHAVVTGGAILRSGVFLGAGSLVTEGKELEGGHLWLGRPAKRVRALTEQERTWFEYSARHYVKLKNDYLRLA